MTRDRVRKLGLLFLKIFALSADELPYPPSSATFKSLYPVDAT
jgi:hypothetical protein